MPGTVGARQNEWFTLDERQLELDGDEPVMRVPRTLNKSRRPKSIPLTAREALLLKEQLLARTAGTTLVFPDARGEQWNRHRFREQVWQRAVEAAGYDSLGFHQWRHTAISLMCRAGYRLRVGRGACRPLGRWRARPTPVSPPVPVRVVRGGAVAGRARRRESGVSVDNAWTSGKPCTFPAWAHLGLNQGPLACEASALPLSYAPSTEEDSGTSPERRRSRAVACASSSWLR
jgi:Phage integrase family